ncbi:MAG: hypothetical protein IJU48_05345, partial [Synergistaceae bacterium]|nr:hypothetical protein [Synergistaceae bacterium]
LEKYGKLGYEDFKGIVSEEFYAKNKFAEFGVSIGKGLITLEQLQGYLRNFAGCFFDGGERD